MRSQAHHKKKNCASTNASIYIYTVRKASLNDVPLLVTMMAEFYSASPCTLNPRLRNRGEVPLPIKWG